jgi:hypothetical protein
VRPDPSMTVSNCRRRVVTVSIPHRTSTTPQAKTPSVGIVWGATSRNGLAQRSAFGVEPAALVHTEPAGATTYGVVDTG